MVREIDSRTRESRTHFAESCSNRVTAAWYATTRSGVGLGRHDAAIDSVAARASAHSRRGRRVASFSVLTDEPDGYEPLPEIDRAMLQLAYPDSAAATATHARRRERQRMRLRTRRRTGNEPQREKGDSGGCEGHGGGGETEAPQRCARRAGCDSGAVGPDATDHRHPYDKHYWEDSDVNLKREEIALRRSWSRGPCVATQVLRRRLGRRPGPIAMYAWCRQPSWKCPTSSTRAAVCAGGVDATPSHGEAP
jgi:hypothetical protein